MGFANSPSAATVAVDATGCSSGRQQPGWRPWLLATALLAVVGPTAATEEARAQGQLEWANKIFGNPTSTYSTSSRRAAKKEARLDDLRSGELPLRSEKMLEDLDIAYGRYKIIAKRGGWQQIPSMRMIRPGDDDERVPLVRKRLLATGELRTNGYFQAYNYDGELEAAVRKFQERHGLSISGRIDRSTIAAMNVPVEARLAQIKVNYQRIANLVDRHQREPRYILVNAAGYQLEAVEAGKVVSRHRIIAGRPGRETPEVRAEVRALNFFPHWRVPDSVAKLDLAPRLVKEPEYLEKERIRVLNGSYNGPEVNASTIDWARFDPTTLKFRQDPGPQNALGLVRLDMPNEHGVYMHDTPMKPLFGRAQRAFSAGCVRVQDVFDLAVWIAQGDQGLDRQRVDEILAAGEPVDITLTQTVPVYFTYITAWAEPGGIAVFRPDVYGRDGLEELSSDREHDPDAPPPPKPGLAP